MDVDAGAVLVVITESFGRNIVGFASPKCVGHDAEVGVTNPMVLIEQFIPTGQAGKTNVNVAFMPVLVSMLVERIYVKPSSYIYVPHDAPLMENYKREWDRQTMKLRAAQAGIHLPEGQVAPRGPNGSPAA